MRQRVQALESEPDEAFALGPAAELLWRGAPVARLAAGDSPVAPQVDVLQSDLLDPPLRERVRRRLAAWLEGHLQHALAPLFALRDRAGSGAVRGLAFVLAEGLGAVARRAVAAQVSALDGDDRRALSRLGVTVGRFALFLPSLLKPESMRLRARLFGVRHGQSRWSGPDGAPSVPNEVERPQAFYLACGYMPMGPRAVRLDRLEHAAAIASRLSQSGAFVPPRELPSIVGCPAAELPAVLSAMGYAEQDGRFARRGRPARRGR